MNRRKYWLFGIAAMTVVLVASIAAVNPQTPPAPAGVAVSNTADGVRVSWNEDSAAVHRVGWANVADVIAASAAGDSLEAFHFADTKRDTDYTIKHLPQGQKYWVVVGAANKRFGAVTWAWGASASLTVSASAAGAPMPTPTPEPTATPTPVAPTPTLEPTATPTPVSPTPVPAPVNRPPRFTNEASFTFSENEYLFIDLTAVDDDDNDSVTDYAITGGADRARFSVNQGEYGTRAGTYYLALKATWNSQGDYENPTDADGDNVYEVVVTVTSGTGARELSNAITITVEVTNVIETPSRPDEPNVALTTETSVTVTWPEPDNDGPDITNYYVRYRPQNTATWIVWPHSDTTRSATITGLTTNADYDVQVRARSPEGTSEWSPSAWATAAIHDPPSRTENVLWTQIGSSTRVRISWNAADNATYYKLYYCGSYALVVGHSCSLEQVASRIASTEYVHQVFVLPGGTTYVRFAVSACNGTGCSSRVAAQKAE